MKLISIRDSVSTPKLPLFSNAQLIGYSAIKAARIDAHKVPSAYAAMKYIGLRLSDLDESIRLEVAKSCVSLIDGLVDPDLPDTE